MQKYVISGVPGSSCPSAHYILFLELIITLLYRYFKCVEELFMNDTFESHKRTKKKFLRNFFGSYRIKDRQRDLETLERDFEKIKEKERESKNVRET